MTYGDTRVHSDAEPLSVPFEILADEAVQRRIV